MGNLINIKCNIHDFKGHPIDHNIDMKCMIITYNFDKTAVCINQLVCAQKRWLTY